MNREIKFRFWNTLTKRFASIPAYIDSLGNIYGDQDPFGVKMDTSRKIKGAQILEFAGQFTGLKDKNGKEIYEGDIYITYGEKAITYQVMFLNGSFVGGKSENKCLPLGWDINEAGTEMIKDSTTYIEIIGNIYENPELIK